VRVSFCVYESNLETYCLGDTDDMQSQSTSASHHHLLITRIAYQVRGEMSAAVGYPLENDATDYD
jgi:hypothetical protein